MNPTLPPDPAIDEIREVRHRISANFDHDPAKLVAYLMQYQEQFRDRLIYDPAAQPATQQAAQTDTEKAAGSRPATPPSCIALATTTPDSPSASKAATTT